MESASVDNWWLEPHQRWSFLHMTDFVPTAPITRGEGEPSPLPRSERDLSGFTVEHKGRTRTLRDVLHATDNDGLLVVHDGTVVFEHYVDGMTPQTRHLCQSVSKSLTAALVAVLVDSGRLAEDMTVPELIPELGGTCWDGCTVTHLLDMSGGVAFDESDYEDETSEAWLGFRALGWMPPHPTDPSPVEYLQRMRRQGDHGERYEYRSILTDVLGWVAERAAGESFTEAFSREVWQPMGAADGGDMVMGPDGMALADGGFCITLPDLARFGLLHLNHGRVGDRQVLPESWTRRITQLDPERAARFAVENQDYGDTAYYRDQWWVLDPERNVRSGYGIHGQQVLVHGDANVVIARFSSAPRPVDDERDALTDAVFLGLCDALADGSA